MWVQPHGNFLFARHGGPLDCMHESGNLMCAFWCGPSVTYADALIAKIHPALSRFVTPLVLTVS